MTQSSREPLLPYAIAFTSLGPTVEQDPNDPPKDEIYICIHGYAASALLPPSHRKAQ
jgi:hypothetical protein